MQTFLPYRDFVASAEVLDAPRLGKQRVEVFQILRALTVPGYAWKNHPAVRMWRGFVPALVRYGVDMTDAWLRLGHADTVRDSLLGFTDGREPPTVEALRDRGQLPPWLGLEPLHLSHRSALVRKDPEHYRQFFPDVPDDLPYLWPRDTFPRWPVAGRQTGVDAALQQLGYDAPRAGQVEAAEALLAGRDVTLATPAGYGGSTAGLLAGLLVPGATLYLTPAAGEESTAAEQLDIGGDGEPGDPGPSDTEGDAGHGEAGPSDTEGDAGPPEREFVFLTPARLRDPGVWRHVAAAAPGLVVVDDADRLPAPAADAVADAVDRLGSPPVLALTGPAGPAQRAAVADALRLRAPVQTGGGFDRPGVRLAARSAPSEVARRRVLAELVRRPGAAPALAVTATRSTAESIALALDRAGLRAAAYAVGMRASRLAETRTRWRSRRLDVLLVDAASLAAGAVPEVTGRISPRSLLLVGAPATLDELHDRLGLLSEGEAAVVTTAGEHDAASPEVRDWLAPTGCRWARLLDRCGEPVAVPCGRCDSDHGLVPGVRSPDATRRPRPSQGSTS